MKKFLSLLLCLAVCLTPVFSLAEEAEAPEETAAEETTASELGDDLYSFQVMIDGVLYTLPTTADSLIEAGWEYGEKEEGTLSPNQYSFGQRFEKGSSWLYAYFINFGIDVLPFLQTQVGEIAVSSDNAEGVEVEIPGGLKMGISNNEDALAAYGEPTRTHEGDYTHTYTYTLDTYQEVVLKFDVENDLLLSGVEVRNFEVTGEPDYSNVSDEEPAYVANYVAPTELGDDFSVFNVQLEGKLYAIPAPFAEFSADGWTIKDGEDEVVPARSSSFVDIRKGNFSMRTMIYNPGDTATLAKHCLVTKVMTDDYDAKFELILPLGIAKGMTEGEMLDLLSGIEPLRTSEGSSYRGYEYGESYSSNVEILISTETNEIYKIVVENEDYSIAN